MAGWVKLHRSLLDWEWYDDANTCRLFIHLLLRANHKPKNWRGISIDTGQLLTGRKALAEQTGLSEQQVRTSLDKLKSTNEITIKSTSRNSLITLVCWESYQQNNQEDNQQITKYQPTDNQQITTNKNVKNIKNEKNEKKEEIQIDFDLTEKTSEVFDFWKQTFGKTGTVKLTAKRKKNIHARLKEGYSLEDIKAAIVGCSNSEFHMGKNQDCKIYDDIELICRNGEKLESFRDAQRVAPQAQEYSDVTKQNIINGMAFLND